MQKENISIILKQLLIVFVILILMLISFGVGTYMSGEGQILEQFSKSEALYLGKLSGKYSEARKGELAQDVDFEMFWRVWDYLKQNHYDKDSLTDKKMFYGAIKGMVDAADDPYTVFMDPKITTEFKDDLAGTFDGIGAEIDIKDDVLTVISPLAGMPAEKAGLKAGDKIVSIDGESTAGLTTVEAVMKIRGPKGTKVKLSILRDKNGGVKEYEITRDKIIIKSVSTENKDGIFVIKVSGFNDDTIGLFAQAADEAVKSNPKGIILDLRNNPGGYLEAAVEMASEWIEDGVVVSEKHRDETKNKEYNARGRAKLKDFKTIVLVNQGSASASEIVAGALQDYDEAELVGEKTFGKGSIQTVDNFNDGSSIKVTIAKWFTPKGKNINKEGIEPDIKKEFTEADFEKKIDPQMDEAVKLLK